MNEKPLSSEELEKKFHRFRYFQNINQISYCGKLALFNNGNDSGRGPRNPTWMSFTENDVSYSSGKAIIEVDTPYPKSANNNYKNKLVLFTTSPYDEVMKEALPQEEVFAMDEDNPIFVKGTGSVQNFSVHQKSRQNDDFIAFLNEALISDLYYSNEKSMETAKDIARALRIYVDDENKGFINMTNVWTNNVQNCTEEARAIIADGGIPYENHAVIQGLIYMPPSIREMKTEDECSLHIKVRVKRTKEDEEQYVPEMHMFEYDHINVLMFGEEAVEVYDKAKQGNPIRVEGELRFSKFKKAIKMSPKSEGLVRRILGLEMGTPSAFVDKIRKKMNSINYVTETPAYHILAKNIIVDKRELGVK